MADVAGIADVANSARDTVGRYFSLISALPAALLVGYTFLLIASGAWSHAPDFQHAFHLLASLSLGGFAVLTVAALGAALVLHPLQFAMVQVLEGYWGSGPVAARLRGVAIAWHLRRQVVQEERYAVALLRLERAGGEFPDRHPVRYCALVSKRDEAYRLKAEFPAAEQVMPTRLGNVLRYYERSAGAPYGLDAVRVMPYLARVAPGEDMAYVNDQRSNLDLAVRLCLTSLLASALWVLFFWRHGLWLAAVIAPLTLAYLSYRGAVVAAREYGRSVGALIALNRFSLYERLHLNAPPDSASERTANAALNYVLGYRDAGVIPYAHGYRNAAGPK